MHRLAFASLMLLIGCIGPGPTLDDAGTDGGSTGGGAATGGGTAVGGDGGATGGGGGSGGTSDAGTSDAGRTYGGDFGWLTLINSNASCGAGSSTVKEVGSVHSASFQTSRLVGNPPPETPRTRTQVGDCVAEVFGTAPAWTDGGMVVTQQSAGTVSVAGGARTITLTPDADGGYAAESSVQPSWAGGETLTLTASGAAVPSFTTTIPAPVKMTLSAPDIRSGAMPLVVPRTSDLQLTWTGGSETVELGLWNQDNQPTAQLLCRFPASRGSGTVPAAALQHLRPGTGYFILQTVSRKTVTAGPFSVSILAAMGSEVSGGCPTGRTVTLQ